MAGGGHAPPPAGGGPAAPISTSQVFARWRDGSRSPSHPANRASEAEYDSTVATEKRERSDISHSSTPGSAGPL